MRRSAKLYTDLARDPHIEPDLFLHVFRDKKRSIVITTASGIGYEIRAHRMPWGLHIQVDALDHDSPILAGGNLKPDSDVFGQLPMTNVEVIAPNYKLDPARVPARRVEVAYPKAVQYTQREALQQLYKEPTLLFPGVFTELFPVRGGSLTTKRVERNVIRFATDSGPKTVMRFSQGPAGVMLALNRVDGLWLRGQLIRSDNPDEVLLLNTSDLSLVQFFNTAYSRGFQLWLAGLGPHPEG